MEWPHDDASQSAENRAGSQNALSSDEQASPIYPSLLIKSLRAKRPHKKSRRGCLNCKARRVKCQETKPACANCSTRDLECIYVERLESRQRKGQNDPQEDLISPALSSRHLSVNRFSGNDLRFFHHYLLIAHPHLPFGSEGTWMTQVPTYAHEYPHLMHAILSLGATHYALISPNGAQYTPMAVTHRGKALQLLNTAMSRGDDCSKADLDSILATCYALVFQAFYMSDGLVDFTVMVRGCAMVTDRIRERFQRSGIFALRSQEEVTAMVGNWLPTELSLNQENLVASIQALDELVPFLQCNMHYKFYHAIRGAYAALQISPQHAFAALTEVYAVWYTMGNHDFMTFIAQGNHVTWGLFLHYITVEVLMHPFLKKACGPRDCVISFDVVRLHQWADTLYRNLPTPIRRLVKRQAEFIALDRDAMRREMDVSDLV